MQDPDSVKGWAALCILISSTLASAGGFIHKVRIHGRDIKDLQAAVKAMPEDVRHRLYDSDGLTIYQPVKSCEKLHERVETSLGKMDEKLDKLIDMHTKDSD